MNRPSTWIVAASLIAGLGACMIIALFAFGVVEEKPRFVSATMQQMRSWSAQSKPPSVLVSDDPLVFDVDLVDINHEEGIWLSGFPSYASFEIALPRDSYAKELKLNIIGERDVSPDAVAALRIGVNGQRIMDRLLAPGQGLVQYSFTVPETMRRSSKLMVSLQLHGDVSAEVCHNERSSGAVFTLLPQSGVQGLLDRPIHTVRDAMAALPEQVEIAFGDDQTDIGLIETAFRVGMRLAQSGYDVTYKKLNELSVDVRRGRRALLFGVPAQLEAAGFVAADEDAMSAPISVWHRNGTSFVAISETENIAISRFLASAVVPLASKPAAGPERVLLRSDFGEGNDRISLAALGVNTEIARITDRKNWRVGYSLTDMPGGVVPTGARLAVQLPNGPDDVTYTLHAELNGAFIGSRTLKAAEQNIVLMPLPLRDQKVRNSLNVTLQRHADDGGCAIARQRYPVQLLESSALLFQDSNRPRPQGFVDTPRQFRRGVEVRIPVSAIDTRVHDAFALLTPILATFVPFDVEPDLVWAGADDVDQTIPDRPFVALWHVPPGTDSHVFHIDRTLLKTNSGRQMFALNGADDLITVQTAIATRKLTEKPLRYQQEPGLIIQTAGDWPSPVGVDFGRQYAVGIYDDGEALELKRSGYVDRAKRARPDLDVD